MGGSQTRMSIDQPGRSHSGGGGQLALGRTLEEEEEGVGSRRPFLFFSAVSLLSSAFYFLGGGFLRHKYLATGIDFNYLQD